MRAVMQDSRLQRTGRTGTRACTARAARLLALGALAAGTGAVASAQTFSCDKINSATLQFDPPTGFSHRLVVDVDQWQQCGIPTPGLDFRIVQCGTTNSIGLAGSISGCVTVQAGSKVFDFNGPPGTWCIRPWISFSPNHWQCGEILGPVDDTSGTSIYCSSQTSSQGCTPWIAVSGSPSASAAQGFTIESMDVQAAVNGLLFYGAGGPALTPFLGGTLCVQPPIQRTPGQNSGGTGCGGKLLIDFNAWIASGSDPQLVSGVSVWAQHFHRDPGGASGATLGNAVSFTIAP